VLAILSVGFPTQRESTELDKRSIKARLETSASSFAEASELYQLVDRMAKQVSAADRAEFELFRLRALRRSLSTIDRFEPTDPAQRAWLKKYEDEAVFSEPAGEWLVKADLYWSLEARYRGKVPMPDFRANVKGTCHVTSSPFCSRTADTSSFIRLALTPPKRSNASASCWRMRSNRTVRIPATVETQPNCENPLARSE
jgi:hypothetical protein